MEIKEGFVICNEGQKKRILKETNGFNNYIFMSYGELLKKVYGEVDKKALFELKDTYGLSLALAKEYMTYAPYVEAKCYQNLKLDSIASVKSFLLKQGLLKKDEFLIYRLPKLPVTFLEYENTLQYTHLKEYLSRLTEVVEIVQGKSIYSPTLHEYDTISDEVIGVCNEIVGLHKKGIPYSNIHLMNLTEEYLALFDRISKDYGIPLELPRRKNILHTEFAKCLLGLLVTEKSFNEILEKLPDSIFIDSFIQMVQEYGLRDKNPIEYIDFIKDQLKSFSYSEKIYEAAVDGKGDPSVSDEDYIFYLGFNQGVSPKIYKDEAYLNDKELEKLYLPTSVDKNRESKRKLQSLLQTTKNLYVSYKLRLGTKEMAVSSLGTSLGLKVIHESPEYGFGKITDSLRLGEALSIYDKTHEKNTALEMYDTKSLPYRSFDHSFKGIDSNTMRSRISEEKPLSVAYSNIKYYFECPFKYYASRILDLDTFSKSTASRLGNYSHAVLEDSYKPDFSFAESVIKHKSEELSELSLDELAKDEFYFDQMSQVLSSLIQFNKSHEELSMLKSVKTEAHVEYQDGTLYFHGFVDKLLYTEINNEIYAAIIDYKTGKDIADLSNVYDGFHLQLPSYMYLLSKYEPFKGKKIHIVGIYLQKVNIVALDSTMDLVKQREKNFRLQGYSIDNQGLLSMLDPDYANSSYIASMKATKDNQFYSYAKTITEEQTNELIKLVDTLIHTAHDKIMDCNFEIAPKKINGRDESCRFCKFKDLCFRDFKDFVNLSLKPFPPKEEE